MSNEKTRKARSKTRKNGENGRRRKNNCGTLERRGGRWLARWYAYDDKGNRSRQSQMLKASSLEAAREELRELTEGNATMTRERQIKRQLARLEGVVAERRDWEDKQPALAIDDAWELFETDVASKKRDPATQKNYGQWFAAFAAWIKANHADVVELRRVDSAIARDYANHLLGKVRGTTFNRHFNALALIWTTLAAHDSDGRPLYPDAKLGSNPFSYDRRTKVGIPRVTLKREERAHRRRVLNLDELAEIMRLAQGEMRVLIALGFYTGLRLGDCVTLKWDSIDRVNGLLTTRSHKTDTETATRIHPALAAIIGEEVHTTRGYLLPELAALYTADGSDDLTKVTTGRVKLTRMINDLFEAAGIKTSFKENETDQHERARPDCGFHSLRHTYVTQLERVGATLAERQLLAGHRTAAMTAHYTHDDKSRVLALPDITAADGADDSRAASEARYAAFCAAWDALGADDRQRALDYANAHKAATALATAIPTTDAAAGATLEAAATIDADAVAAIPATAAK